MCLLEERKERGVLRIGLNSYIFQERSDVRGLCSACEGLNTVTLRWLQVASLNTIVCLVAYSCLRVVAYSLRS